MRDPSNAALVAMFAYLVGDFSFTTCFLSIIVSIELVVRVVEICVCVMFLFLHIRF